MQNTQDCLKLRILCMLEGTFSLDMDHLHEGPLSEVVDHSGFLKNRA